MDRRQLAAECKKRRDGGADFEHILSYPRNYGCWKIDSIAILREAFDIGLGNAKELVHLSSTWHAVRDNDDAVHDALIDALAEIRSTIEGR